MQIWSILPVLRQILLQTDRQAETLWYHIQVCVDFFFNLNLLPPYLLCSQEDEKIETLCKVVHCFNFLVAMAVLILSRTGCKAGWAIFLMFNVLLGPFIFTIAKVKKRPALLLVSHRTWAHALSLESMLFL